VAVREIDLDEFETLGPVRHPAATIFTKEVAWYKATKTKLIGSVVYDRSDKDFAYVILAPDGEGDFRWIGGDSSLEDQSSAESSLLLEMTHYEKTGKFTEELYSEPKKLSPQKLRFFSQISTLN
jgi:hypothetical protein